MSDLEEAKRIIMSFLYMAKKPICLKEVFKKVTKLHVHAAKELAIDDKICASGNNMWELI